MGKLCEAAGCTKRSSFDVAGGKGRFCVEHKLEGMMDVKSKRCEAQQGVERFEEPVGGAGANSKNKGKRWTAEDDATLLALARDGRSRRLIASYTFGNGNVDASRLRLSTLKLIVRAINHAFQNKIGPIMPDTTSNLFFVRTCSFV